jgi:hypothetical protein
MDPLFYSRTVTFDTSTASGAAPGCTDALRDAFQVLTSVSQQPSSDLRAITEALSICPEDALKSTDDVVDVRDWAAAAFDMMAMGNYPYRSSYMLNGNGELPAFPMRVACKNMMASLSDGVRMDGLVQEAATVDHRQAGDDEIFHAKNGEELLKGLALAVGVWYNYTGAPLLSSGTHVQSDWNAGPCAEIASGHGHFSNLVQLPFDCMTTPTWLGGCPEP